MVLWRCVIRGGSCVAMDGHRCDAGTEVLALPNHGGGLDEGHDLGHVVRGGDGAVEAVREHADGAGGHLALDQPARSQTPGNHRAGRA